jgi:acetyl esterase
METEEPHPQAQSALTWQRRLGLTPLHEQGVRKLRLLGRVTNWLQNRNPPSVGSVTDGAIPGPDGDLPVRVYAPDGSGPFPTLVFFHGGAYVLGGLASHDLLCRHLCLETDCVVMAVDYRLAPEHPFPAAVEDAYAATAWAADNPDRLAGDGQLAVVGDSAGGTLAAVTALRAAEQDGPEIDHQVLLYPGIGIEEEQPSVRDHAGKVLAPEDFEWIQSLYFDSAVHRRNPYADPSNACDLSGVAPATVLTAGFDPLRDGGVAYAEQLRADGVPVEHRNYDDMIHGFATQLDSIDRAHQAVADVATDLDAAFADA